MYDDINAIVSGEFTDEIISVGAFTCHYLNNQLIAEVEVEMASSISIAEARVIATRLRESLINKIHDVDDADVRLALTKS